MARLPAAGAGPENRDYRGFGGPQLAARELIPTRRVSLSAGPVTLVRNGDPVTYREKDAARVFARERVPITLDLGGGNARAVLLASDLGHDYVSINADYRS